MSDMADAAQGIAEAPAEPRKIPMVPVPFLLAAVTVGWLLAMPLLVYETWFPYPQVELTAAERKQPLLMEPIPPMWVILHFVPENEYRRIAPPSSEAFTRLGDSCVITMRAKGRILIRPGVPWSYRSPVFQVMFFLKMQNPGWSPPSSIPGSPCCRMAT